MHTIESCERGIKPKLDGVSLEVSSVLAVHNERNFSVSARTQLAHHRGMQAGPQALAGRHSCGGRAAPVSWMTHTQQPMLAACWQHDTSTKSLCTHTPRTSSGPASRPSSPRWNVSVGAVPSGGCAVQHVPSMRRPACTSLSPASGWHPSPLGLCMWHAESTAKKAAGPQHHCNG